jgi:RHS repeat-associated protein
MDFMNERGFYHGLLEGGPDDGVSDEAVLYYDTSWQVIAESNFHTTWEGGEVTSETASSAQYIWGQTYIDDMVLRDRDADSDSGTGDLGISDSGLEERIYAQHDANHNVTSLTDDSGSVQERFVFDAYGSVTVLGTSWSSTADAYGWIYLHQGTRYETDLGLYDVRHRFYSPNLGRWMRVDPLRYPNGMNEYLYEGAGPVSRTDQSGLEWNVPRGGGERAFAVGGMGDTVDDLAKKIGLSPGEFEKWLAPHGGSALPTSSSEPLKSPATFTVPNTAYVDCSAYGFGPLGWWAKTYANNIEKSWKAQGFKVVRTDPWGISKQWVIAHARDPNIYKYFFIGHGDKGTGSINIMKGDWDFVGDGSVQPLGLMKFGVAEMLVVACYTNKAANNWATNVSVNGSLETWPNISATSGHGITQPGTAK